MHGETGLHMQIASAKCGRRREQPGTDALPVPGSWARGKSFPGRNQARCAVGESVRDAPDGALSLSVQAA